MQFWQELRLLFQFQLFLQVTQEKAAMEAKNKARAEEIGEGNAEEMTEFEIKKIEKEKEVVRLREEYAKAQEKVRFGGLVAFWRLILALRISCSALKTGQKSGFFVSILQSDRFSVLSQACSYIIP